MKKKSVYPNWFKHFDTLHTLRGKNFGLFKLYYQKIDKLNFGYFLITKNILIATEQQYKLQYLERGLKDLLNECVRKHIFTRWKIAKSTAHNSFG